MLLKETINQKAIKVMNISAPKNTAFLKKMADLNAMCLAPYSLELIIRSLTASASRVAFLILPTIL